MSSEWRVAKIPVGEGQFLYQVYRIKDINKVDHSGNREVYGAYEVRGKAEKIAKEFNERNG